VFENRALRKIFVPKRDEMTREWRKLHNEEHRDLYSSLSIIRIITSRTMRWAGHVARMWEKRNAYKLLMRKPEGKRLLERPRRRWVDNIRMYLGEVGWGDVDWIGLAKDRNRWRALVNSVLNLGSMKWWETIELPIFQTNQTNYLNCLSQSSYVPISTDNHQSCTIVISAPHFVIFHFSLPLWSIGQSSWLQIRSPEFDSRHYQVF
jgi:hypothetical protein